MTTGGYSGYVEVALSLQRALWNMITPSLRCIAISYDDAAARIRFVYDEPVTEEHLDLVSEVETEVVADLYDQIAPTFVVEYKSAELRRTLIGEEERWFYMRREPTAQIKAASSLRGFD